VAQSQEEAVVIRGSAKSPTDNPFDISTSDGPVFLVGMNGSGTTMLRDSLCRHPDLYGFLRETRLLPRLAMTIAEQGSLKDDARFLSAWRKVQSMPSFALVNGGAPPPIPEDWHAYPRSFGAIADAFFQYFAQQAGKHRWCEKSPQNVQHLQLLGQAFPNARFVHLIRDGRACAASFHRRWGRRPELTIYRWKKVVEEGRRQGESLGERYMELRYEELTRDPERWMRSICEFLGLDFVPEVLNSRQPQSKAPNRDGKIQANPESWSRHFGPAALRRLEGIAGGYLAELGYETCFSRGIGDPSPWRLKLWNSQDMAKLYVSEISRKAKGNSRLTWGQVLRRPFDSIQQRRANRY
jgi:hypothetical protein